MSYPFRSIRDYLDWLDKNDYLLHVKDKVSNKWMTAAVGKELFARCGYGYGASPKAALYENLEGYPGTRSCNMIFGHIDFISAIVGSTREKLFEDLGKKIASPKPPIMVKEGLFMEKPFRENECDIYKEIPVETTNEKQAGPFFTLWCLSYKDPNINEYALSMARHQVKSERKLGVLLLPGQHLQEVYGKHKEMKENIPIALINSPPPTVILATQTRVPRKLWKMSVAGALQDEGIECVKTDINNLPVPATSEYVLEGEIVVDQLEDEGPFGTYTGYYDFPRKMPIINVKALYHRENPIYNTCVFGKPPSEGAFIGEIMMSFSLTQLYRTFCPEVKTVRMLSTYGLITVIALNKKLKMKGSVLRVGSLAAALQPGLKLCILVDDDIDCYSVEDILWAICTRWAPNKSQLIGPLPGFLDPSERWQTGEDMLCLLYTSPSPRDLSTSRMPSSA